MSTDAPTDRQAQILRVIRNWIADHGEGPSIRQIGEQVGLSSSSSVAYQLARLEDGGLASRTGRRWRSCHLGRGIRWGGA
ncbi:hypothetical protein ACIPJO_34670 [Streptomyces sp. NPDC086993]|uniref:LexA family protein n=1 Tax=unclassified Streptomyces TaxID=2593676 RepID=UPI003817736C